jgi:predicted phosphoribosyltransferase
MEVEMLRLFRDRHHAGQSLARELVEYADRDDVVVLGLPRGGVPVAYEVAAALNVPLEPFVVRKIGAPQHEEFAIGAIASGGISIIDRRAVAELGISEGEIGGIVERESRELARRERLYRGTRPFPDLTGKTVILVDDGLATGASMRVAVEAIQAKNPARVVAAAPVASRSACSMLRKAADACVCVADPEPFYGVGMWYEDFSQTTDDEVIALLESAEQESLSRPDAARSR